MRPYFANFNGIKFEKISLSPPYKCKGVCAFTSMFGHVFILECNLSCLVTTDKNYLGKDSIDKFDALIFKIQYFRTDEKGKDKCESIKMHLLIHSLF